MIYIFLEMCEEDISISSFLIAAMNTTMNKLALEFIRYITFENIRTIISTKLSFNIIDITNRKNLINKIKKRIQKSQLNFIYDVKYPTHIQYSTLCVHIFILTLTIKTFHHNITRFIHYVYDNNNTKTFFSQKRNAKLRHRVSTRVHLPLFTQNIVHFHVTRDQSH